MDKAKRDELNRKMGNDNSGKTAIYKLNDVQMSGDDGKFTLSDLVSERPKGERVHKHEMGMEVDGVIIKMRWRLERWDDNSSTFYKSTEYDNKNTDKVTVYPSKDSGSVIAMKEKYNLATRRIIYFYVPSHKEIVRLIVKASALTGADKNPKGELGLFEYLAEYQASETLPCQYITSCSGVFRAGKNEDGTPNKRKDHVAMTFKAGRELSDSEFEKVEAMIDEVDAKTGSKPITDEEVQETPEEDDDKTYPPIERMSDEDVASSIPF